MSGSDPYWPLLMILRIAWVVGLLVLIGVSWALDRLHVPVWLTASLGVGYFGTGWWLFRPNRAAATMRGGERKPPAA